MTLLKQQLNLNRIPKWIPIALLVLALVGFGDATYLTVEHYLNKIPPCSIGGCETVLTSQYSNIIGIPVSLLGAVFYLFTLVLLFLYLDSKKEIFLRISLIGSIVGMIPSVIFILIMAFIVKALCPYCLLSDTLAIVIFALSYWSLYSSRQALE